MSLINPQLRCTEAGLLTFESPDFVPERGGRNREQWLDLASEFLPITTEANGDVTTVTVNLRDGDFQEAIAKWPGIPFEIGLLTRVTGSLMSYATPEGVDPVVKFRTFDEHSIVAGVHLRLQEFLCSDGITPDIARSVVDVMSLPYGLELNREGLDQFETHDKYYRGGSFRLRTDAWTFRVFDEAQAERKLSWPIINLETLGDSTTYGYVGNKQVHLNEDTRTGRSELYSQSFSNVDHSLHALSLAMGVARLVDVAATHEGTVDIFSDDFEIKD